MAINLTVNGARRSFAGDPDMPLLWYLRDELGLVGTGWVASVLRFAAKKVAHSASAVSCPLPIAGQLA